MQSDRNVDLDYAGQSEPVRVVKEADTPEQGGVAMTVDHDGVPGLVGRPIMCRRGRALLGWLPDDMALTLLSSGQPARELNRTLLAALKRARERVATRARYASDLDVGAVRDVPPELSSHVARLCNSPVAAAYVNEGWSICLVDLTRVCAFQPSVAVNVDEAVAAIRPDDWDRIADVSLPIADATSFPSTFDAQQHAWTFCSMNPNLRIIGHFAGQVAAKQPAPACGFFVGIMSSFMQVARFQDRLFLRDGYHRAHAFLRNGVTVVPVFVKDFDAVEALVPPNMLPQHAYLGPRPPTMADYLDDTVSTAVNLPVVRKLVVVQATELTLAV